MKIAKLLTPEIPEDSCSLCEVHERAIKELPPIAGVECPNCKQRAARLDNYEVVPVGEYNGVHPDHDISLMAIYKCTNCLQISAIQLKPIMYNGNHDVYYTGGSHYLPINYDSELLARQLKDGILPLIEQYTDRLARKESLDPWNLLTWIQYKVEAIVAKYIFEQRERLIK